MPLAAHGATHPGRRASNEDALVVDVGRGVFIVADGMGGHNAGEVASALAVQTIHDDVLAAAGVSERVLHDGICRANAQVLTRAAADSEYTGMGTTVVVAVVADDCVTYGSVGDSRIYLWRRGELTRLTRDDSWISQVLEDEALTVEAAQRHPLRHVLTKVVGLRDQLEPAIGTHVLSTGDVLLLCSDGLHGVMDDDRIARALARPAAVSEIGNALVADALTRGASDNVTVVVVRAEP